MKSVKWVILDKEAIFLNWIVDSNHEIWEYLSVTTIIIHNRVTTPVRDSLRIHFGIFRRR